MRYLVAFGSLLLLGVVLWAQKPFREYQGNEYNDFPLPTDYKNPAEFTRARLLYSDYFGGRRFRGGGSWTTDYPRSDRHLLEGIRRLTRIDTKSVEQVVALDQSDDIYNWPFTYAVEVGHWQLSDEEGKQLRDYINRGGFFMVDDFHGTEEWEVFLEGLAKVFPNPQIVDLRKDDAVLHTVYDISELPQVPGMAALGRGVTYEYDGYNPDWKAILDERGRIVVAICHNMDLGDAWEHSDDAYYPEKLASLAYRIGMNYFIYDFTH